MSVRRFGIYTAYPPGIDLRKEGLGHYLSSFLRGASSIPDVQFVVVCPSWSVEMFRQLLGDEFLSLSRTQIVAPTKLPLALRAFSLLSRMRVRLTAKSLKQRVIAALSASHRQARRLLIDHLARCNSVFCFILLLLELSVLLMAFLVLSPVIISSLIVLLVLAIIRAALVPVANKIRPLMHRFSEILGSPQDHGWVLELYDRVLFHETSRLRILIGQIPDIDAWYCPAAFWPSINAIDSPTLICVPDVVLMRFPVGFSQVGGDRYLNVFKKIQETIEGGKYFVTYSQEVKQNTLIEEFGVNPSSISVIHHAPKNLADLISINVSSDAKSEQAATAHCRLLLRQALSRATSAAYSRNLQGVEFKYLFYASQFRPNKNIVTLLKAYKQLNTTRFSPHKLLLTGHPGDMPQIGQFVRDNKLEEAVLFIPGLSDQELAACYFLAELAINPSLSEGGCPFTFSEALSVGTPVVMGRIGVTQELLTDPELQAATFFDPYDWRDMADRIEWALLNRDKLLEIQLRSYEELAKRSWTDVANEHIEILERISSDARMSGHHAGKAS